MAHKEGDCVGRVNIYCIETIEVRQIVLSADEREFTISIDTSYVRRPNFVGFFGLRRH